MKIANREDLAIGDMSKEFLEKQPLPIGRKQFHEWADRIIQGAVVEATEESLKFSLANMIMHLGPTEAFREDAFFILQLRKAASNQTAHAMIQEFKETQEAKRKLAEATAPTLEVVDGGVLENKKL